MAANDRVKTKELKRDFEEIKGKILSDLNENLCIPPKQGKLTQENLEKLNEKSVKKQKKNKPKWAYTEKVYYLNIYICESKYCNKSSYNTCFISCQCKSCKR